MYRYKIPATIMMTALIAAATLSMARADTSPPLPQRKAGLEDIQNKIKQEQVQKQALAVKLKDAEGDLKKTKKTLVDLAKSITQNEDRLQELEDRIAAMQTEESEITTRLEKDYGSISNLVLALERLQRVPTEALIVRPGAPLETAQSAMLLQDILPRIHQRAETLQADLDRLKTIETDTRADKEQSEQTTAELKSEYKDMAALVEKRERFYKSAQNDYAESERTLDRLATEAKSMQELMDKLAEEQRKQQEREAQNRRTAGRSVSTTHKTAFLTNPGKMPGTGSPQIPVSGIIRVSYGQKDDLGATSKGLSIESRDNALVVAPMGGIVRFAGHFKNYGQLIIIEHEKGFHSLIAGLGKVDTVVGQSVEAGEPIGTLPGLNNSRPKLYYELRYKGKPVNPSTKFSDLS